MCRVFVVLPLLLSRVRAHLVFKLRKNDLVLEFSWSRVKCNLLNY